MIIKRDEMSFLTAVSHTHTIPKTDKMEMGKPALLKKTVWHQCKHSRTGQRKSIQLKYADTHTRN